MTKQTAKAKWNDRCIYWRKQVDYREFGGKCSKTHGHRGDHTFIATYRSDPNPIQTAK